MKPSSSSIGLKYRASLHASTTAMYLDSHVDITISFCNFENIKKVYPFLVV